MLNRRTLSLSMIMACVLPRGGFGDDESPTSPALELFHAASCGCCRNWVRYMEDSGFLVRIRLVEDIKGTTRSFGIPDDLAGCHVAQVDGYLVGGHVPVDELRKLLTNRPPWKGIFVPGMPKGAPGLEGPGQAPYQVFALARDGSQHMIATYQPIPDE